MRFTVFSHVPHFRSGADYYAYAPYVREINIWGKYVSKMVVVANLKESKNITDNKYDHAQLDFKSIKSLNFTTIKTSFISISRIPSNMIRITQEMRKADHIHIRCPGNIGLLALLVQVFFPGKPKTIKYAGNWDLKSKQPLSYNLQKWILRNEILTQNAKVLVYGDWKSQSKNIIPFFTASYKEEDQASFIKDFNPPFKFLFVGSLTKGKRPFLTIKIIQELTLRNFNVSLDIYGEGELYNSLASYVNEHKLENVILHGGQDSKVLKSAYKSAHFSILPSKSEGWPKALAEAMFYGCVPVSTSISCIAWMFDSESRGILIKPDVLEATKKIESYLEKPQLLEFMSKNSQTWSQRYTLEKFEKEISSFL